MVRLLQWTSFCLQKIVADIAQGGLITRQLIGDAKNTGSTSPLDTISLGSKYVLNFIIPLSIELALKALIIKEGEQPDNIHDLSALYDKLPDDLKEQIEQNFLQKSDNKNSS